MKTITCTLTLFLGFFSSSQESLGTDYYSQLFEINKEWRDHPNACPKDNIIFNSDKEKIQTHLLLVCNELELETPTSLTLNQKKARLSLIGDLRNYAANQI